MKIAAYVCPELQSMPI